MGICASASEDGAEKAPEREIYKLFLVGAGESGKSTLCKQMELMYGKGYSNADLKALITSIRANLVLYMQRILEYNDETLEDEELYNEKKLAIAEDLVESKAAVDSLEPALDGFFEMTPETASHISKLWMDPGIRNTANLVQMDDSAEYFLDRVEECARSDFVPSVDDIVRNRMRTAGISRTRFEIGDSEFEMIDVGGQRSERKKWGVGFKDATSILFVVGLSSYDQVLLEDGKTNRMVEAFSLWEEVTKEPLLADKSIILFLNKRDLYQKKIQVVPITTCPVFSSYSGDGEYKESINFVCNTFIDAAKKTGIKRQYYSHVTCAIDQRNVLRVFTAVKDTIISLVLKDAGLLGL